MYYKSVDLNNNKACFNFLVNHFEYDTMNSWNGWKSIANNVKVYNIPDIDDGEALKALQEDDYLSINQALRDWEDEHPGYEVTFNGRSSGYLVLYRKDTNRHALIAFDSDSPCNYYPNQYEDWKRDVQNDYGSLKAYHSELVKQVKLVQAFDQLCDDLVALTKELIADMHKRQRLTRHYECTLRFQRFYYETIEDLKLHMLDMKRRGYSVWEWSEEDLFAEYEMNEAVASEIVLDEEGDEDFVC